MKGYKKRKLKYTKEFLDQLPKYLDPSTGCWLYLGALNQAGYGQIRSNYTTYNVHRLAVAIYHDIDYWDRSWQANHVQTCTNKHCFNPTHVYPGSHNDNMKDMIAQGNHKEQQKKVCPNCGGPYTLYQSGNKIKRKCKSCRAKYMREIFRKRG